jgi:hypothetical protein
VGQSKEPCRQQTAATDLFTSFRRLPRRFPYQCTLNPALMLLLLVVWPKSVTAVVTWGAIELLLGAERIMRDRVVADARQSHAERCPGRKNVELDRPFVAGHLAGWWRRSGRQCHQAGDRTRCGRLSDQDPLRPNCFIPFAVVALQRLSMTRQALTRAFMVATFAVASARLRSQPVGIAGSGRAAGAARSANAKAVGTTSPANQRKACTKRLSMADLRDYPLGRAE